VALRPCLFALPSRSLHEQGAARARSARLLPARPRLPTDSDGPAMIRRAIPVAVLLSFAACAPSTEWSRADTTPEQLAADERACAEIAQYQALDESFASGPKYPPLRDTQFIMDSDAEGGGGGMVASYSRRGPREYELTEYCMQQRGYQLVPVRKP